MRKVIFISALFMTCAVHAQVLDSNKVPIAARQKLHVIYPHAVSIEWARDDSKLEGIENGIKVIRELSFRATVGDGRYFYSSSIDSTGRWYEDRGTVPPQVVPIVPPTSAFNKVVDIMPAHKELSWEYNDEPYYDAQYEADGFKNDSDENVEYHCYFDSLWQYMGWSIDIYNDTSLIPVHAVNTYIRKHYNNVEFADATIDMDKDGAIKQIEMVLELKHGRFNMRILRFNGKGQLAERAKKGIAYHGIDF